MRFTHYSLGHRQAGEIVEVSLSGNAANVRLLDSANFSSYKRGRHHRFYGGLATKSPVRLVVPHSGNWHAVVDMMGLTGAVRSNIRVFPWKTEPIREAPQC